MQKVFVGLSGGVDSAVSAALLKQQGHDVTGVFIKIWQPEFIECTWREDRLDAMRVAAALDIPFREVDFSEEYKREVVEATVADYARGLTPNPDVLCNRAIKFGHFLKWAREQGAEYIATGHYARIVRQDNNVMLMRGADTNKDQSYFLWQLGQGELSHAMFPVGELSKPGVRALAKKFGLPNAEKHDSQGLCFVGDVSMDEFLGRYLPLTSGPVLDKAGARIGEHRGAALYTAGERHGFTLHGGKSIGAQYVVATDIDANILTVSPDRSDAAKKEILLEDVNWISAGTTLPLKAQVQARYRETPVQACIERTNDGVRVTFDEPHLVSAGQSLVMYTQDRCLGGGIIC